LAMPSKIEFYREVLRDDPASRVFFPLSKMLAESGQTEEAVAILTKAINVHPGHLEARFFLVELLTRLSREVERETVFEDLLPLLSSYPSVWSLWAAKARGLSRDSSVAMHLVARALAGAEISFLELLEEGLSATAKAEQPTPIVAQESSEPAPQAAKDDQNHAAPPRESSQTARPKESSGAGFEDFSLRGAAEVRMLARRIQDEGGALDAQDPLPDCAQAAEGLVKTRTMADLLAKRGDYAKALRIYENLMDQSVDPKEREVLGKRISEIGMSAQAGVQPAAEPSLKREGRPDLRGMLEALAGRLDARAAG